MMLKFIPLLALFILVKPGQCQHEDTADDQYQSSDQLLRKFWGIQDVTTSVGKLFHYKIPNDAFKGTILYYDVVSEENDPLPAWMIYDKKSATLEGVPTMNDTGDTRINVKAYDNKKQSVSDVFVVEVYPLWEKNTNNKRKCKKGEGVMMISIEIDKNLNDITPTQKVFALKSLARYLRFPVNTLLLLPSRGNPEAEQESMLFDNDIFKDKELNSSIITWQIGCKEKIWAEKLQIVELVEKYVKDGTLSNILQLPLIRWHITSSFNPFRTRRNAPQKNGNGEIPLDGDDEGDIDDDNDNDDEDTDDDDLDDKNVINSNSDAVSPSPVPSQVASTQLYQPPGTSNPYPTIKKSIIDSAIANHSSERQNIRPNATTFPLSPDTLDNEEDTTDADESMDVSFDLNNGSSSLNYVPSLPPAELPTAQSNISITSLNPTPLSSTSTEKTTTTVLPSKRFPPRVERNLDQIPVEAGKPYKIKIPEDIFSDTEDGNTRNLTLRLNKTDNCTLYTPWIELNTETQELYILANLDTVSEHVFSIEAIDSDNMTTSTSVIVNVQYPSNTRTINFEVSLHLKLRESQNLTVALQLNLLNEIARLYNDENPSKITVRHVTCDPFVFTWSNTTLSLQSCDNNTILGLLDVLTKSRSSMDIKKDVYRDFETNANVIVEKVLWKGIGLCEEIPPPRQPQPEKQNFKPTLRNRIDNLTATVGELKIFKVPEDTFYDADEPNGRNLKLSLLTIDHFPIPPENWLQFDSTNQEFYGLPMSIDVGTVKYELVCNDNQDDSETKARHVIEVNVEPVTKAYYSVEFRMKLSSSYDDFVKSPLIRRTFVEKLAKLFGDKTTSSIVISAYSPGSLIVIWHNKSLPVNVCAESEIVKLRKVLLTDDSKLDDNVNKVLKPEFEALSVDITPIGVCEGGLTELHPVPTDMNSGSQEISAVLFGNPYFTNSILPIMIIVLMIFVAGLIACVLYRRQRSAKWTLGDEDERRTYRNNKGIPVIFQDELEERLEPTNKSPIIMKEEKPPLPPPEYQKNPPVATTALLSDFDDPSYQQGSGTYTARSTERNGRPKPTPIYRKPPPYVSQ